MSLSRKEEKELYAEIQRAMKPPLTRAKLLTGVKLFALYETDMDSYFDEWYSYASAHGSELLGLALAAIDRLEVKKRGVYAKYTFGSAQQRALEALRKGPMTTGEIAAATGAAERNLRRTLVALAAREILIVSRCPKRKAKIWSLPGESE